jgi:hypothetical protein
MKSCLDHQLLGATSAKNDTSPRAAIHILSIMHFGREIEASATTANFRGESVRLVTPKMTKV